LTDGQTDRQTEPLLEIARNVRRAIKYTVTVHLPACRPCKPFDTVHTPYAGY